MAKVVQANIKNITPEEHHCDDEIMVVFKGRAALKRYMQGKPNPWGFKLWPRAGVSGILYNFDVYQGLADVKHRAPSALGIDGDVVLQMVEGLESGKNCKIFADNFFSNLSLVKALRTRFMFFVGTFRANRLKRCQLKLEKHLKKLRCSSLDMKVELESNIIAVHWFDSRCVDTLSSYIGLEPVD
uniref:PiggyBac transposable element-derived protein domain-containing protein n=1 Tax=Octopus bimaculoides TaxID=37653 RepID=A0A0L8FIS3_OCTBM